VRFTPQSISFGKRIDPGSGGTAYLDPQGPNDVVGWWYTPSPADRQGGPPLGNYVGVGSYVAVTTTHANPALQGGQGVLVVLLQRGFATHLIAVASPNDHDTLGLAQGGPDFAHFRWARVLGVRRPDGQTFKDLVVARGVPSHDLPFDKRGGAYIALANVGALAGHVPAVQAALWSHFGFDAVPAIYAEVTDPGGLHGVMANPTPEP
jgi:hypothetical protein